MLHNWDGTSEKSKLENYTPVADTPGKTFSGIYI